MEPPIYDLTGGCFFLSTFAQSGRAPRRDRVARREATLPIYPLLEGQKILGTICSWAPLGRYGGLEFPYTHICIYYRNVYIYIYCVWLYVYMCKHIHIHMLMHMHIVSTPICNRIILGFQDHQQQAIQWYRAKGIITTRVAQESKRTEITCQPVADAKSQAMSHELNLHSPS